MSNDIELKVIGAVGSVLRESNPDVEPPAEIDPRASLFSEYGLTSLSMTFLIMSLERKFQIDFEDDELNADNFMSVKAIVSLLSEKGCVA